MTSLAFQASGGVGLPLADTVERGRWELSPWTALTVRARARLWAAAVAVGVAAAALDDTIAYTTERVVFGKPVAHHQGNAFDLAHAAARVHGARLAVRDAAAAMDGGGARRRVLGDPGVAGDDRGRRTWPPTSASSCSAATASSSTTSPRSGSARRAC